MIFKYKKEIISIFLTAFLVAALTLGTFTMQPVNAETQSSVNERNKVNLTSDKYKKIGNLIFGKSTLEDIIIEMGEPDEYIWGDQTFKKDNLPDIYAACYGKIVLIMEKNILSQIHIDEPGCYFNNTLHVGLSTEEVFKLLGRPKKTVKWNSDMLEEGVLYTEVEGEATYCVYDLSSKGIQIAFFNNKAVEILVFPAKNINVAITQQDTDKTETGIKRYPGAGSWTTKSLDKLPVYNPNSLQAWQVDLRNCDLTKLNLKDRLKDLLESIFDTKTKWPTVLPKDFNPKKIIELGKNPGLGVKSLNKKGITGKDVCIAFIDQVPIIDHAEYKGKIKAYDEINIPANAAAELHGCAMLSLAVGKDIGVAPGANVNYIATNNADFHNDGSYSFNYTSNAAAINKILDLNKTLTIKNRIRVISMSCGWTPSMKGYKELKTAIDRAKKEGVFVVSVNMFQTYGFYFQGLERNYLSDPEKVSSYSPMRWDKWMEDIKKNLELPQIYETEFAKSPQREVLLVPTNSRTVASFTGKNDYAIYRDGGWSCIMPYISGLYAMACQVNPDVTPELFWKQALKTGDRKDILKGNKKYLGKIVNPVRLMDSLKK